MRIRFPIVALVVALGTASQAQVSLGQTDTFDSNTLNWQGASPTWISTGGPGGAGDAFLRLSSDGTNGAGGHMATHNANQWSGNYVAAGIGEITVDLDNLGASELDMRLVIFDNLRSTQWESNAVYVLSPNSGWQRKTFVLNGSGFTQVEGTTSFVDTLTSANQIMFRHNPSLDASGVSVVGTLGVDNVHAAAVPEPETLAALGLGLAALARRIRRT